MYNPGWIDQPNFYWENNQSFESCDYNEQREESHLEEALITFIQVSQENHHNYEQRFQQQEARLRQMEVQVGQIAEALQGYVPEQLPN